MKRLALVALLIGSAVSVLGCATKGGGSANKTLSEFDEHPYRDPNRIKRVRNAFNTFR